MKKNLRHLGYEVINLCYADSKAYYPTFFHRMIGAFQRKVLKDENYDKKMIYSRYTREINQQFAKLNSRKADFALCIRANVYPREIIQKIREHSQICINYQWDGIEAHPDILSYLHFFDQCYVFDHSDVEKYPQHQFKLASNFYFDYPLEGAKNENQGGYFLGGFQKNRVDEIQCFLEYAKTLDLNLDFYIVARDDRAKVAFHYDDRIHYLHSQEALNFEENLKKVSACDVVVDFLNSVHQGLSFRTFDAICFNKKLITNNQSIKQYDFYHPHNIFVWDSRNLDGLAAFLKLPYQPLAESIKQKYSFSAWLNRCFDLKSE